MSRTGEMSRLPPLNWDQYGPCGIPIHMCADWEGRKDANGTSLRGLRRSQTIGEFIPVSINGVPTGVESHEDYRQPTEEMHSPTPRSRDDTKMSSTWGAESMATLSLTTLPSGSISQSDFDASSCATHDGLEDASVVMDNCSTSSMSLALGDWADSMELSRAHHDFRDGNSATAPFDKNPGDAAAGDPIDHARSGLHAEPRLQDEAWMLQPRVPCDDVADDATSYWRFPEPRFQDKEHAGAEAGEEAAYESNTTRMVQNLPRYISRQQFMETLDMEFEGLYNFCHMPKVFNSRLNMGYAFVNFVTEEVAEKFSDSWNRAYYPGSNSKKTKRLRVTGARVQGFDGNVDRASTKKMSRIRCAELRPFFV